MKKQRTKSDSATVRISKEARRKLKIRSAQVGMSFIDYVDFITK